MAGRQVWAADKVILAAVPANFPPQYSIDKKTGRPTGFAIDLMDEVARRAGLSIRYIVFETCPLTITALEDETALIIPNCGITHDRQALIDFTSPVETIQIHIFVRQATIDIKNLSDLSGRNVSVVKGNKGVSLIREFGRAKMIIHDSIEEAFFALLSGNSDALVYPETPLLRITRKTSLEGKIKAIGPPLLEVKRAIGVRKGHDELFQKINVAVDSLLKDPKFKEIYVKWYGKAEPFWTTTRMTIVFAVLLVLVTAAFLIWHMITIRTLNKAQKK